MASSNRIEAAFELLSENLQVPPPHRELAKRSYQSVGNWLERAESSLQRYRPKIYPQGSFSLGTAIRPATSKDEYDVDVVCQLDDLSTADCSQEKLKRDVGKELTAYAESHSLQNAPEEKRRCWTLNYADGAQFHIDILPAVPNEAFTREILMQAGIDFQAAGIETAIAITDQSSPDYNRVSQDWPVSNPKGYLSWFRSRMGTPLSKMRADFAAEPLPKHRTRTPLQSAIQIIKRHRDLMFEDISDESVDPDDKPISIILTTLATHAYCQEATISGALGGILDRMDRYIGKGSGGVWIANPSYPSENFADRWQETPHLQNEFHRWLARARQDYEEVARAMSKSAAEDALQGRFDKPSSGDPAPTDSWTDGEKYAAKLELSNATRAHKQLPHWPSCLQGTVEIKRAVFSLPRHRSTSFENNSPPLRKGCDLRFSADTNIPEPYEVYWQVTNTGEEAARVNQLRGDIFLAKTAGKGGLRQKEKTAYRGAHSIECFIVKDNILVARSDPFIVNIQ